MRGHRSVLTSQDPSPGNTGAGCTAQGSGSSLQSWHGASPRGPLPTQKPARVSTDTVDCGPCRRGQQTDTQRQERGSVTPTPTPAPVLDSTCEECSQSTESKRPSAGLLAS